MKNGEIAALFEKSADVMAVLGENTFRVLAYRKIARTLDELTADVEELAKSDALEAIPGIGESSAEKIREYLRTGKIGDFESLWGGVPAGVMEMMKIPTMGPKTAALLWREAGVKSVAELKDAIDKDKIKDIAGIGAKKLKTIRANIDFLATSSGRVRISEAMPVALAMVEYLKEIKGVEQVQYCGSLRRAKETIGDVDIAVAADASLAKAISDKVTSHPLSSQVIAAGESKTSIRTASGLQVDVRVVPGESFGAAVQYFTGSKEHNVKLRGLAIERGLKLNEWGLFRGDRKIAGETEEGIYAAMGMAMVSPEMREDRGEMEWGAKTKEDVSRTKDDRRRTKQAGAETVAAIADGHVGAYPVIEIHEIRGDLHMHTTASDGSRSIEEMAAEAKRRGLQYIAITDHSKSQFQANGLSVERLLDHVRAIHAVAKEAKGILVLAGSEVDILADGSMDYEDDVLAKLDWVVASPHAALTQDADAATARLVRAAANPLVHVIGHPTGRLVPTRKGLEPDMQKVIFAAARSGCALELNANTWRLDLRDTHLKMAAEAGVPICINTDAHGFEDFDMLAYGVLYGRRGWLKAEHVLNTRPLAEFKKWLAARRNGEQW